jgi:hypothetical protein
MPLEVIMVVQTAVPYTDETLEQIRPTFLSDLGLQPEDFEEDTPLVPIWTELESPDILLSDGKETPAIYAFPEHTWLDVHLIRAYYGRGYERGYLPLFVQVAEWLEGNLLDSRVWYGEDCSGIVRPFGSAERTELQRYYEEVGDTPYRQRHEQAAAERAKRYRKT